MISTVPRVTRSPSPRYVEPDGPAVDGDGLHRGELAEAGAAGVARDETDDRGDVAAGQPQVAAGDAADEEAAVADLVDGGPAAAGPHFEADDRQAGGRDFGDGRPGRLR